MSWLHLPIFFCKHIKLIYLMFPPSNHPSLRIPAILLFFIWLSLKRDTASVRALFFFSPVCHPPCWCCSWGEKKKNSQPGLNLPITISRCQTAEILREEHKPETRPRSIKLLLAPSDLISVLLLYINICKCNVIRFFCPLSVTYRTALARPRTSVTRDQLTGWKWAGNSLIYTTPVLNTAGEGVSR